MNIPNRNFQNNRLYVCENHCYFTNQCCCSRTMQLRRWHNKNPQQCIIPIILLTLSFYGPTMKLQPNSRKLFSILKIHRFSLRFSCEIYQIKNEYIWLTWSHRANNSNNKESTHTKKKQSYKINTSVSCQQLEDFLIPEIISFRVNQTTEIKNGWKNICQ